MTVDRPVKIFVGVESGRTHELPHPTGEIHVLIEQPRGVRRPTPARDGFILGQIACLINDVTQRTTGAMVIAFGQLCAAVLSGEGGVPAVVAEQGLAMELLNPSRMQPGAA